MEKIVKKILDIKNSSLLHERLYFFSEHGASDEEIENAERSFGYKLDKYYKQILKKWNGLDLHFLRIFSVSESETEVPNIFSNQDEDLPNMLAFGSDPAGFLYLFDKNGAVYTFDYDGGGLEVTADNLEDFICNYAFGPRAAEFAGEEWLQELKDAGIV
jgi:hypothetical protein